MRRRIRIQGFENEFRFGYGPRSKVWLSGVKKQKQNFIYLFSNIFTNMKKNLTSCYKKAVLPCKKVK